MLVKFTHLGCFIEEEGRIIVQGHQDGRMFILDTNDVGIALFAKGQKIESDINLWHKWIRNLNYKRLESRPTIEACCICIANIHWPEAPNL